MKKISKLEKTIIGLGIATLLFSGCAKKEEEKFKFPEYELGQPYAVFYKAINVDGSEEPIKDLFGAEDRPVRSLSIYPFDLNKDGWPDLVHVQIDTPYFKYIDIEGRIVEQQEYKYIELFIDDNYDTKFDRKLLDYEHKDGTLGADGKFDKLGQIKPGESPFR
ncbi:MAG: hypothetical protein KKA79_06105 [Nanoarchaeota archaeon]|nr:hypothetical protein [Nanoarchaeota archaeon]